MTPITVEGVTLLAVEGLENFGCFQCALNETGKQCVRINPETNELYFDNRPMKTTHHLLYCINQPKDIVFIKNTPKQIAKYVAARLEST